MENSMATSLTWCWFNDSQIKAYIYIFFLGDVSKETALFAVLDTEGNIVWNTSYSVDLYNRTPMWVLQDHGKRRNIDIYTEVHINFSNTEDYL